MSTIKSYINSFYEKLQSLFDNSDKVEINLPNANVTALARPADKVNVSGNLKMSVLIPLNTASPNYCESIINGKLPLSGCFNIILGTLMSQDFVADPTVENLKAVAPGANAYNNAIKYVQNNPEKLLEMLKTNVSNPVYAWNLNYGRNMNSTSVKKVSAHVINSFNAVIDYVISNDVKKPDAKFRELVRNIFANQSGNVYNYAHYTLMLPAMVNYFASKGANDATAHATRYTGIVKKGSGLLPQTNNASYEQEDKWHKSGETLKAESVCPYAILNNGVSILNVGAYNYPFTSANKTAGFHPKIIDVPTAATDPAVANITFPCTSDKYSYNGNTLNTVVATTPLNADGSARDIPPATYFARDLDWNSEFKSGTFRTPYSAATPGQGQFTCHTEWDEKC